MKKYSVSQVSKELNIPKDTLRYYDKLKLVSPFRGENKYRYYSEENLMELMFIEVTKYAGFSLSEIKRVALNKCNGIEDNSCREETIKLLETKENETLNKINHLNKILLLYRDIIEIIRNGEIDITSINKDIQDLILNIYKAISIKV